MTGQTCVLRPPGLARHDLGPTTRKELSRVLSARQGAGTHCWRDRPGAVLGYRSVSPRYRLRRFPSFGHARRSNPNRRGNLLEPTPGLPIPKTNKSGPLSPEGQKETASTSRPAKLPGAGRPLPGDVFKQRPCMIDKDGLAERAYRKGFTPGFRGEVHGSPHGTLPVLPRGAVSRSPTTERRSGKIGGRRTSTMVFPRAIRQLAWGRGAGGSARCGLSRRTWGTRLGGATRP